MVLQFGLLWPCPQILRAEWKGFPRANPLAYFASSSVTKKKSFITLTPGWKEKDLLEHKWTLGFISLTFFMQNGQNLSRLLFRPLMKFGVKLKMFFFYQSCWFWLNFIPFCLVLDWNLLLCTNITIKFRNWLRMRSFQIRSVKPGKQVCLLLSYIVHILKMMLERMVWEAQWYNK